MADQAMGEAGGGTAPGSPAAAGPPAQDDTSTSIWPLARPEPPGAPDPEPPTAAQQFPALDPELLQSSVQATSAAPPSALPTRLGLFGLLWRQWLRSRLPLLVAVLILLGITLPRLVSSVVQVTSAVPVAGLLSILLWGLYAVPLVWVFRSVDFFEREPSTLIGIALAWGGAIATTLAVTANQALFSLLTSFFGEAFTVRWGSALAAPTTEEALKALGVVTAILIARRGVRSAIDGFVVGAMVGVGFQVVENFVYTGNLLLASGQGPPLPTVLSVFFVRGIGSGLWSHAVYSGVAGMGIGYAFTRRDVGRARRAGIAAALFALAWFLHFVWNLPVLVPVLSPFAAVVKAAIILGLLAVVLVRNRGRESYIFTGYLASVHDPAVITDAEIESLRTYRSRESAARRAATTGGERAAYAVRKLQRRQADLSVAMANGDLERIAEARRGIAAVRREISSAALLPDEVGHNWGVASIWMSVVGLVLPIVAPIVALVLAAIGTREAQRKGSALAGTVRLAWLLAAVSMVIGLALIVVLTG